MVCARNGLQRKRTQGQNQISQGRDEEMMEGADLNGQAAALRLHPPTEMPTAAASACSCSYFCMHLVEGNREGLRTASPASASVPMPSPSSACPNITRLAACSR